MPLTFLDKDCR